MAIIVTVMRNVHTRVMLLFAVTMTVAGCFRIRTLPAVYPGDALAEDEVFIVGRARFEPLLSPAPSFESGTDAALYSLQVGLTWEPNLGPSDAIFSEPIYVEVEAGLPFVVVGPRRPFHIRSLMIVYGTTYYANPQTTGTSVSSFLKCRVDAPVEVGPNDTVVYIGLFTCHREDLSLTGFSFTDEWALIEPLVAAAIGDRKVVRRVPP